MVADKEFYYSTSVSYTHLDWLGKEFLDGADWLRKTKPLKYRHMYLGEMVGSGTQVFDNILSRKITAKEIAGFDNIISGVDWGYYPDPWVFIRTYYHAATRTLYIFCLLYTSQTVSFAVNP